MFRLAHLSDIHLAPLPRPSWAELASKRITGYLNWKLNRKDALQNQVLDGLIAHLKAAKPDHIALTGDLINLGLDGEISRARDWLEKLGSPRDVSMVPGNHDAYVPGALAAAVQSWLPYLSGDGQNEPSQFPYLRHRSDVALIGLNSGCATLPFMATGKFDEAQAKICERMLIEAKQQQKFRVVSIHHPPFENATGWSKRLIGDKRFRELIKRCGTELVLHGHTHVDSFEWIDGPDTDVAVVGVPSASKAPTGHTGDKNARPGARYNLFEISGKAGKWNCMMNEYGFADGGNSVSHISKRVIYKNGKRVEAD